MNRYPEGSLWTLYKVILLHKAAFLSKQVQAKYELMNGKFDIAVQRLQEMVLSDRIFRYKQTDALVRSFKLKVEYERDFVAVDF